MPPPGLDRANTPGDDLHRVVARGWAALRDRLDAHDRHLPGFVSREVRGFVRCGDPAHGFAWLRCPEGHHHRLVPFSCKGRGFCPSCGGRRMATLAHRWTDELLPRVAVRQLVLTVPWPRRWLLARRPALARAVLRCALRVVTRWLRSRGGAAARAGAPGSVTVIQRFGSALNLNLHFHVLMLDGLFVPGPGGLPRFQRARPWTQAAVDGLVEVIAQGCEALLVRHGHAPDVEPGARELSEDDGALPLIQSAAVAGRSAVRARPAARRVQVLAGRPHRLPRLCATAGATASTQGGHPGPGPRRPAETRRDHRAAARWRRDIGGAGPSGPAPRGGAPRHRGSACASRRHRGDGLATSPGAHCCGGPSTSSARHAPPVTGSWSSAPRSEGPTREGYSLAARAPSR